MNAMNFQVNPNHVQYFKIAHEYIIQQVKKDNKIDLETTYKKFLEINKNVEESQDLTTFFNTIFNLEKAKAANKK